MKKLKPPETNTRILRTDHVNLLELAKTLHTKPGTMAGWLLEIYRKPGQPDEHAAGLVLLGIVIRHLDQLAQRLVNLNEFVIRERDLAEPKSTQYDYAEAFHQDLTRLRQRIDTEADLCQAIAAALAGNKLPADLLATLQAAEAWHNAGPDPDDEPLTKLLAYLVATRILYVPPTNAA